MKLTHEQIAELCHTINRFYSQLIGDPMQPRWEDMPEDIRKGVISAVYMVLNEPDMTPRAQHEAWCDAKVREGFVYGPVKDLENRTHPLLIPYDQLPKEQQAKDSLFMGTINALKLHDMIKD